MFINNLTGKPIKDISFAGYWFSIPAGVSICWDDFGKFLFTNIYKVAGEGGVPPVVEATAAQWKSDRYVDVRRFELNSELVPKRADLIKLGKERGVDAATIELWKEDDTIDNKEIANAINDLAVPDHIKYPVAVAETTGAEPSKTDEADKILSEDPVASHAPETAAPATIAPTAVRKTGTAKKAAARPPRTPAAN